MYEGTKYVDLIIKVDGAEGDTKINFMTESMKRKNAYVWPSSEDEIWVKFPGIISITNEPIATGKSKMVFTIWGAKHQKSINPYKLVEQLTVYWKITQFITDNNFNK
jgi:hypothetical protein